MIYSLNLVNIIYILCFFPLLVTMHFIHISTALKNVLILLLLLNHIYAVYK